MSAAVPAEVGGRSEELRLALRNLGFQAGEAESAISHALATGNEETPTDELLRAALGYFRRSN